MNIALSSGHSKHVRGASGHLDEVDEARKVVERVGELLRREGVGCKTFHDDTSDVQKENLTAIVKWHKAQTRDRDVSIHFNAHQQTHKAMGTEVCFLTEQNLAATVAAAIAKAGHLINRGPKKRTNLYFLNKLDHAILIEVCFVDSSADASLYRVHFEQICQAIAATIGEVTIQEEEEPEPGTPPADEVAAFMPNHTNIVATVFGGGADPNNSAYQPYDPITDEEVSCALPCRITDAHLARSVEVRNQENGKTVICRIRDLGPWNTDDYAYVFGDNRPQAESGTDKKGRTTNNAGIDLTPAAAAAIGLEGKGVVSWRFVEPEQGEVA
jgi:N-acetylmuramoyl-L-alanine amidase